MFGSVRLYTAKTFTGTVKSFVSKRGFGFVELADGKEVFVHNSEIKSTGFRMLVPQTQVKFELQTEQDGKLRALQVRNLDDSPIEAPPAPKREGGMQRESRPSNDRYGSKGPSRQ